MNERRDDRLDDTPMQRETRDARRAPSDTNIPTLPVEGVFDDPSSDARVKGPAWTGEHPPVEGGQGLDGVGIAEGMTLHSVSGDGLGEIESVYGYPPSTEPYWATLSVDDHLVFVPLVSANVTEDGLRVPYTRDQVESAPVISGDDLTLDDEMALYTHYNERRILPAESAGEDLRLQVIRQAA